MAISLIISIFIAATLGGCASTKTKDVFVHKKITGAKIIAMSGSRDSWVYEIEKRLRKKGFSIKRMVSQKTIIKEVSPTKTEAYNETSARFILNIDGYAPNTSTKRCFGGGYDFNYINAELIDVKTNETILHYSNSGYSENCPPLSGTIFTDIVEMVFKVWK